MQQRTRLKGPHKELGAGTVRINRYLADCALGSRRSVEELVQARRVSINGTIVSSLGQRVAEGDEVRVDRRIVKRRSLVYAIFHKPAGVICSRADERRRTDIYALLPPELQIANYVGRLDAASEGLLLLTNDGELAARLTHPRHKVEKEYEVTLDRAFQSEDIPKLLKGTFVDGKRAKAERVESLGPSRLKIVLTQGMKRQIRVMLFRLGYEVERLVRTRFGPLRLDRLPIGKSRMLKPSEVKQLQTVVSKVLTGTSSDVAKANRAAKPVQARLSQISSHA